MFQRTFAATVCAVLTTASAAALWLAAGPASAEPATREAGSPAAADQVLTWTAGDSITDYQSVTTTAVAGQATIVFENSPATGNTTGIAHTLTFDTSTPGYNHDVDVNIVASPADSSGGRHEVEVTLTPGTYRFYCAFPGHQQMVGELVVTAGGEDTTPPEVSAEVSGAQDADGNYLGSAALTVTASDAQSGVDLVEVNVDGAGWVAYTEPVTVDSVGSHTVGYRATDVAGNTSAVEEVSFAVVEPPVEDTTPPEVSAHVMGEQDPDGNFLGSAQVMVMATDDQSGVDLVEVNVDGAGWVAYAEPVTVDSVGSHTVAYRATDVAGNTSAAGEVSFAVVEPPAEDTTPPEVSAEVSGEQDAEGNYVGTATVTVTATDAQSGVDLVEVNVDGAGWVAYTEPVVVDSVGSHTVGYRATDVAGNTSAAAEVSFAVVEPPAEDTTPPEVSAEVSGEQDAEGNYVGTATVTVTATDAQSGVDVVEVNVDGTGWETYTEPVSVDSLGSHTVAYRATDVAGNTSEPGDASFTVVEGSDACPNSDERPTVVIDGIDTGVANADTGNGCTINDLVAENGNYPSHGDFVRHVERVTADLVADGLLTMRERGRILAVAARSDVGWESSSIFLYPAILPSSSEESSDEAT